MGFVALVIRAKGSHQDQSRSGRDFTSDLRNRVYEEGRGVEVTRAMLVGRTLDALYSIGPACVALVSMGRGPCRVFKS